MSNQRELKAKAHRLGDIGDIMTAMKNLAFMETRKLEHHLNAQQRLVEQIRDCAQLCYSHYPDALPRGRPDLCLCLVIGSERGFCADFNQRLLQQLPATLAQLGTQSWFSVGQRLELQTVATPPLIELSGPSASEEIEKTLIQLTQQLTELEQQHGPFQLNVLFNHPDQEQPQLRQLLPPFAQLNNALPEGIEPIIQMPPEQLLLGLGEHYLFASLQQVLYLSLMAENQRRINHLQGAIKKLEQRLVELQHQLNRMRQEAIIEEIEIILINQSSLDQETGNLQRTDS